MSQSIELPSQAGAPGLGLSIHNYEELAALHAVDKILAQPGAVGIRYYYAQTDDGNPTLVLVGVDAKGQDMQTGVIMERGVLCPPFCYSESEFMK